jgi:hypothetical protein
VAAHVHGIVEDVEAGHARGARSCGHVARQDAHGGGLAGAIGAEETEDFAFIHGEGNVVHGGDRAVRLRQILNFDQSAPPDNRDPAGLPDSSEPTFILKISEN